MTTQPSSLELLGRVYPQREKRTARAMAKTEITTIQPTDTNLAERIRQDLERDVRHAVHARRATLKLLELKIHGMLRRLPVMSGGD